jgi:hypothetical protein
MGRSLLIAILLTITVIGAAPETAAHFLRADHSAKAIKPPFEFIREPQPAPIPQRVVNSGIGGNTERSFSALHIYFITPTGNDKNSGTSLATAWATPKHNIVCGDVIIVQAGNYTKNEFGITNWGVPSDCPSTSGGIDGTGGIYFAVVLCGGADLMSCKVTPPGTGEAFRIDQSNWAVEGFWATASTAGNGCYIASGNVGTVTNHHVAFINDIASTCGLSGFATSGGGFALASFDQTAAVGVIAYNGANSLQGFVCGSGISFIPGNGPDTSSGTHVFVGAAFAYKNQNASGAKECKISSGINADTPHSDGEGIIFDSWAAGYTNNQGYNYQGVVEQSVIWANGNNALQAFPQGAGQNKNTNDRAQVIWTGNTTYGNGQDPRAICGGEMYLNQVYPQGKGEYQVTNNIFLATTKTCGDRGIWPVYGAVVNGNGATGIVLAPPSVTVSGNWIFNNVPPTANGSGGKNTHVWNLPSPGKATWLFGADKATWLFGTNTYADPGLAGPAFLPSAAPDCAGRQNVTDCMLNKYGVYNAIRPTTAPTTVGYQPPTSCRPDELYPTYLKGIVYLHWDGIGLTEVDGLLTKPCAL